MIAANARRTAARFRAAYATGLVGDLRMALVSATLRLGEVLDLVDAALAESGWLVGDAPSVTDFALYGWLMQLVDLDGWDLVQSRQRVAGLMQALTEPAQKVADTPGGAPAPSLADGTRRGQRASEPTPSA